MSNSKQLSPRIEITAETFLLKPTETTRLYHMFTYRRSTTFVKPIPVTYAKNPSYNQIKSYEETFKSKHNRFYEEIFFV